MRAGHMASKVLHRTAPGEPGTGRRPYRSCLWGNAARNAPEETSMAFRHLTFPALAAGCLLGSAALVWAQTAPGGGAPGVGTPGAATGGAASGAPSGAAGSGGGGGGAGSPAGGGARAGGAGGGAGPSSAAGAGTSGSGTGPAGEAGMATARGGSRAGTAPAGAASGGAGRDGTADSRSGMSGGRDGGGPAMGTEGGRQGRMGRGARSTERGMDTRGGYDGPRQGIGRATMRHRPGYGRRIVVRHGPVCRVRLTRVRTAFGPRLRKVRVCRRW